MLSTGLNYWTVLFCLGQIFISSREVLSQDCSAPQVANSIFAGDSNEGGNAAIICNTGYEGGGTIECQGGYWLSLPPCTPKACPDQNVVNGDLTGELFYRGSANVYCDPGYEGGGAAECGSNGAWVTVPTCTPVDCHDPGVHNGQNVASTLYGESHFIQCDTGYTGGGAVGIECLANGTWDITLSCDARVCGDPKVANGNLTGDNVYGGTASIECHPGYEGGGSLTCQSNGAWGAKPSCDLKNCNNPTKVGYNLGTPTATTYGGTVSVVSCDTGYTGSPSVIELTCLNTGRWSEVTGCTVGNCNNPTKVGYNLGTPIATTYGGTVNVVSCDTGYTGSPSVIELTCLDTGRWSEVTGCTIVKCNSLCKVGYVLGTPTATTYGGYVSVVSCDTGYTGRPSVSGVTCQETGDWSDVTGCTISDQTNTVIALAVSLSFVTAILICVIVFSWIRGRGRKGERSSSNNAGNALYEMRDQTPQRPEDQYSTLDGQNDGYEVPASQAKF